MKKKTEWITELTEDIVRLKNVNRKTLYLISAEMNTDTAKGIEEHFLKIGYGVEIRKCLSCKKSWDLIISWT